MLKANASRERSFVRGWDEPRASAGRQRIIRKEKNDEKVRYGGWRNFVDVYGSCGSIGAREYGGTGDERASQSAGDRSRNGEVRERPRPRKERSDVRARRDGGEESGNYFALESTTGPEEAWFLELYDSFDAVEQQQKYQDAHAAMQAKYNQVMDQDAQFVNEAGHMTGIWNETMS